MKSWLSHNTGTVFLFVVTVVFAGLIMCLVAWEYQHQKPAEATTYYADSIGQRRTDQCNRVRIDIEENPTCPRVTRNDSFSCPRITSTNNPVADYTFTVRISSNDGQAHTLNYGTTRNFCTSGTAIADSGSGGYCACIQNEDKQYSLATTVPATGTQTITLSRASSYGYGCGTYQMDFWINSVDSNASCTYGNDINTGASGLCETGITCTGPIRYSITGNVFADANQNRTKDGGESNYPNGTFTATGGTVTANAGSYTISGLAAGTYTVSYTSLPAGYAMLNPLNGPPPSFQVTVGGACNTQGAAGASCSNGNIQNLNFAITDAADPWMQIYGADVRFDNGYTSMIPQSPIYPGYASVKDTTSNSPGVIYSGNRNADFGRGQPSQEGWVVGGTSYPEVYNTADQSETSYQYLLDKATQAGITITNLNTVQGCGSLGNCTLPANLPSGIYRANGDVALTAYTVPANRDYIFLINGTLTFNGRVVVPNGSVAFFSTSRDIVVNRTVAATANTSPPPAGQLQGFFSADRHFIVGGTTDCTTAVDRMLNMEGAIVVNAGKIGGTFTNNRDLCGDNSRYPSFTIRQRLDFLMNVPTFLMQQSSVYREENP